MAERLVWLKDASTDPMELDCGHTTLGNGRPTPYTRKPPQAGDEWYCALCGLHAVASLDQEIELVQEQMKQRKADSPTDL